MRRSSFYSYREGTRPSHRRRRRCHHHHRKHYRYHRHPYQPGLDRPTKDIDPSHLGSNHCHRRHRKHLRYGLCQRLPDSGSRHLGNCQFRSTDHHHPRQCHMKRSDMLNQRSARHHQALMLHTPQCRGNRLGSPSTESTHFALQQVLPSVCGCHFARGLVRSNS